MARVVSEVTSTKIRYLPKNIRDYPLTEEGQAELRRDIEIMVGKRTMVAEKKGRKNEPRTDENGNPIETIRAKRKTTTPREEITKNFRSV